MTVAFDTLKFARALREKANMSADQAEGVAEAFSDAVTEQLATKPDLAGHDAGLRVEIGALRADLARLGVDLRAAIAEVRAEASSELAAVKAELSARIDAVKAELSARIDTVRAELLARIDAVRAELLAQIDAVKAEVLLLKWMVGFNLALSAAILLTLLRR